MVMLAVALATASGVTAQSPSNAPDDAGPAEASIASDEQAVRDAVERFLIAIGSYDLEALPPMFTANANIGAVRLRDGRWQATTYTFEDFHSMLKARTDYSRYQEPVSRFTVHVEPEGLAFVRADATLVRDGRVRSNNIDYFTLMKEDGVWRFLSASYVARPIPE
jgi:hypothetical protein